MSNYPLSLFILSALAIGTLYAEEAPKESPKKEATKQEAQAVDLYKVSEAFGHLIGKNIESLGFEFDINQVVKGLQDAAAGKQSPMSEKECVEAISSVKEKLFKEQAQENLKKADAFLSNNAKTKDMVVLENGKLQYKIEKAGNGATVQSNYSPLIRYTGKFADGTVFGASKEDELISLEETIPGFSKGLVGMKEGEKRTLYIHPDLAYGTNGFLPPNSLLTFDIEVVKANAANATESISVNDKKLEISTPSKEGEALR